MRLLRVLGQGKKVSIDELLRTRNRPMQGLSVDSLRHHMAIQPLFAIMAAGVAFVVAFSVRSALKEPEVAWVRHDDEPLCDAYKDKRFQMVNVLGIPWPKSQAPDYRNKQEG